MASCRKEQKSHEWPAKSQGLFTYFLAQGLSGAADFDRNGLVDTDELYRFTVDQVPIAAQLELNVPAQTPVRIIGSDVVGVFALARVAVRLEPPPPPGERLVTASFTVREGNESGPLVSGAEVSLHYCPSTTLPAIVLGTGTSDLTGLVRMDLTLSPAQETQGEYTAVVVNGSASQSSRLATFPDDVKWNLDVPKQQASAFTNSIGIKLVLIPAGEFLMGSPDSDRDAESDEKPQHKVQISKPFYLGVAEVTQQQYCAYYDQFPGEAGVDPIGPDAASDRVFRGGSWDTSTVGCRSAIRHRDTPSSGAPSRGFRLAAVQSPR